MSRLFRLALCSALILAAGEVAWARVGGGESYGGGGGSYSSGGGGGGDAGFLIYLLIRLVFAYPAIGIPLVIVVAVAYFAMNARSSSQLGGNLSTQQARQWSAQVTPARRASKALDALRRVDRNFSTPLFLDFVNLLYTRVQTERTGDLAGLAGYLAPDLRQRLVEETRAAKIQEIRDVIVGSIRIADFSVADLQTLTVDLETNYVEVGATAAPMYAVERWTFARRQGVLSKGPVEITKLNCPSCGSPAEFRPDGSCPYCGENPATGSFAWVLVTSQVRQRTPRPRMDLRQGGEEIGTDDFTKMQPDFELRRKEFMVRHPDFSWPELEKRIRHTFLALQQAWSQGRWELARPYETDHLFSTHRYWIEAYAREGLANRIEEVEIEHVVPVKIETDAYYDAMTVRLWASAKDWTEELATGRVLAGSKDRDRRFTEYWTFLRRSGFQGQGAKDPSLCPNCGAPLEIGQAGICPFCDSKITTGEFDWTLSLIEQDEAYEA